MNKTLIKTVLVMIVLASGLLGAAVRSADSPDPAKNPFEEIKSGELPRCASGVSSFLDERIRRIEALVELCGPTQKVNTRAAAMHLLGKMRATEACPVLTEHIGFISDPAYRAKPSEVVRLFGRYPAQEALVGIGKPSLPYLLTRIKESPGILVGNICRGAIVRIEGLDHARELIEETMKEEKNPEAAERLGKQLGFIEKKIKGRRK